MYSKGRWLLVLVLLLLLLLLLAHLMQQLSRVQLHQSSSS
jgi:uncharacterized integral membrane protein